MPSPSPTRRSRIVVPVIVAVSLALITAVLLMVQNKETATPTSVATPSVPMGEATDTTEAPASAMARRAPGDPLAKGDANAPVVMVAYSEFQCPFCGKFARDTEPTLVKEYVDKGILRIEWRDFPYLGQESLTAAKAARAAGAQGKFWQFHDAMYDSQLPPNSGRLTQDYVVQIATRLGLDVKRFTKDMGSAELAGAIQRDFQEGQSIGVTGTPAFLVNGQPIIGAQPTGEFQKVIEAAAKAAS